jgi:trans-aconitate methyltransferase
VGQFHFDPDSYLDLMRAELPRYEVLQDAVAAATAGIAAADILELGTGTGETARRVLARHPRARLVGVDESAAMLAGARRALPWRARLLARRLQDPLPPGPFDVIVSCLAVHHLPGRAKAALFRRVHDALRPGGRLVLGDVVVPDDRAAATTPLSPGFDHPSGVAEQVGWLSAAGLPARAAWRDGDLAVIVAGRQ